MPSNESLQPQNNGDTSVAKSGTMPKTSVAGHENLDMFSFGTQYGQIQFPHLRPTPGGWTNHLFFLCSLAQKAQGCLKCWDSDPEFLHILGTWGTSRLSFKRKGWSSSKHFFFRGEKFAGKECICVFKPAVSGSQKIGGIGEKIFLPQLAKMLIKIPLRKTTYSPCLLGGNYFIPAQPPTGFMGTRNNYGC